MHFGKLLVDEKDNHNKPPYFHIPHDTVFAF